MSNEESGCAEIVEWGDHRFRCPTAKAAAILRRVTSEARDDGFAYWPIELANAKGNDGFGGTVHQIAVALGCHRIGG